jgi:hypothetical protein
MAQTPLRAGSVVGHCAMPDAILSKAVVPQLAGLHAIIGRAVVLQFARQWYKNDQGYGMREPLQCLLLVLPAVGISHRCALKSPKMFDT